MHIMESRPREVSMKHKTVNIILSICLILLLIFCFTVLDLFHMGKFRLSAMSNWACKQFILQQGATIPEEFSDMNFPLVFAAAEAYPDRPFVYGWTTLGDWMNQIRDIANAYYGIIPQGG